MVAVCLLLPFLSYALVLRVLSLVVRFTCVFSCFCVCTSPLVYSLKRRPRNELHRVRVLELDCVMVRG
jgi:hypothetical protein